MGKKNKSNKLDSAQKPEAVHNETKMAKKETVPEKSVEKRKRLVLGVVLGSVGLLVLVALAIVYFNTVSYYRTHFLPNSTVNGIDCSAMEAGEVIAMLDAPIYAYSLEVGGRDYATGETGALLGTIVPGDIQLIYAGTKEAVEALLEQQDKFRWFLAYMGDHYTYDVPRTITFDEKMLEDTVQSWDACRKQNMLHAENAYISAYSDDSGGYEVIGETIGSELDMDKVIELVIDAVYRQAAYLDVEEAGCYGEADIKADNTELRNAVDTANKWLSTSITYDWNGSEVVLDREILKDWISIEENCPMLDEDAVAEFVEKQADVYDTYERKRIFRTSLGVDLSLLRRTYGWKTDVAAETEGLISMIYEGANTQREPIYVEGITARRKGEDDIGNSYVEVDLTNQHLYLYWEGRLALETDFVSGDMSKNRATPQGIFGITYKSRNAILTGADYENFASYWMPFYRGYGLHDATWRDEFGGDIYLENGSHGCVNLPLDKAGELYQYMSKGFPVICYYYEVNPLAAKVEVQENEPTEAPAG